MIERRLLAHLRQRASARGIVALRLERLRTELIASEADLSAALKCLEQAGKLKVVTPFPFLVVKLHSWSGIAPKAGESERSAYSYSYPMFTHNSYSYSASERELLEEILETLGETEPRAFYGAIRNYPADVIRKALDRVRRTRVLRKNRTALFRYLLSKLS